MENRYPFTLDLKNRTLSNIKYQQGDTDTSIIEINLVDGGLAKDITGQTIVFYFDKPDGTTATQDSTNGVSVINALTGNFQCILKNQTLAAIGIVACKIKFTDASGKILSTAKFNFTVEAGIGDGPLSTNYITQIETAIAGWQSEIDTMKAAYDAATKANLSLEVSNARTDNTNNKTYDTLGARLDADASALNDIPNQIYITEKAKTVDVNNALALKTDKTYSDANLALKRDKATLLTNADLDTSSDTNKVKLINLADEVKTAMAGTTSINATPANGSLVKEKYAPLSINRGHANYLTTGKNLFDLNTAILGYRLNPTTGVLEANASYYVSDYIPAQPNTQLVRVWGEYPTSFYDNQYNLISFVAAGHNTAFTTPANCAFIRLSLYNTVIGSEQLELGATPTTYESYGLQFASVKQKSIDTVSLTDTAKNYFKQDMYPFQYLANFNNNSTTESEIRGAIKKIELYGVDFTKKYCLGIIERNFSTYGTGAYIYECDNTGATTKIVALTAYTSYVEPSGIDIFNLAEYSGSGITAKLYIDWSKITTNKQYVNTHYDKTGLDIRTYINTDAIKVNLPSKIDAVIGDTIEIFYKGIVAAVNPLNYNINFKASKGNRYKNRWIYTPQAGDTDFTITVDVYNNSNTRVATGSTNIHINTVKSSPLTAKNALMVGDSLSGSGVWQSELRRRLCATGGSPSGLGLTNLNFIGTCGTVPVKYEGYGGWTWNSYITAPNSLTANIWVHVTSGMKTDSASQESIWKDSNNNQWQLETIDSVNNKLKFKHYPDGGSYSMPASGSLTFVSGSGDTSSIIYDTFTVEGGNPFWNNSLSRNDFLNYCSVNGFSGIDYCFVLLGWNEIGSKSFMSSDHATTIANAKTFINQLHSDYPNCKVVLLGLEVPSQDGLGANYGSSDDKWNYYFALQSVFGLNDAYQSIASDSNYSAFVEFANIASQFDSDNNMMTATRPVNLRNSNTEVYGINGVHPDTPGYYQIADVAYRNIMNKL